MESQDQNMDEGNTGGRELRSERQVGQGQGENKRKKTLSESESSEDMRREDEGRGGREGECWNVVVRFEGSGVGRVNMFILTGALKDWLGEIKFAQVLADKGPRGRQKRNQVSD